MEILSQRDSRWKDQKLGTSSTTIGGYGCTITCVAMLAGLKPNEVNDRLKAVGGYANGNLIIWQKIKEAIPWLEFETRGYSYDNARVKQEIAENGGCLVEVDFDGNLGTRDTHWVLFVGNGRMYDPWTGKEESTGKYKLTGYSAIKKGEQMTERQQRILATIGDENRFFLDGDPINKDQLLTLKRSEVDALITAKNERDQIKSQLATVKSDLAKANATIKTLTADVATQKKSVTTLTASLKTANTSLTAITKENEANKATMVKLLSDVKSLQTRIASIGKLDATITGFYDKWTKTSGSGWIAEGVKRLLGK